MTMTMTTTTKTMMMTTMMTAPVPMDVVPWPKSQSKREAASPKFDLEVWYKAIPTRKLFVDFCDFFCVFYKDAAVALCKLSQKKHIITTKYVNVNSQICEREDMGMLHYYTPLQLN